jgi:hypothetical protein
MRALMCRVSIIEGREFKMVKFSSYDITKDGSKFFPEVVADANFQSEGVLYGHNDPWFWGVVDRSRHPLFVWKKTGLTNYQSTAEKLGAVLFSNGPMMDRFTIKQLAKRLLAGVIGGAIIGAIVGGLVGGLLGLVIGAPTGPGAAGTGVVGFGAGASIGAISELTRWRA